MCPLAAMGTRGACSHGAVIAMGAASAVLSCSHGRLVMKGEGGGGGGMAATEGRWRVEGGEGKD